MYQQRGYETTNKRFLNLRNVGAGTLGEVGDFRPRLESLLRWSAGLNGAVLAGDHVKEWKDLKMD